MLFLFSFAPVLTPLVLAELDHLVRVRLSVEAARTLADDVAAGAYGLVPLTAEDVRACVRVDRQYADLGIGLADASLVDEPGRRISLGAGAHGSAVTLDAAAALAHLDAQVAEVTELQAP